VTRLLIATITAALFSGCTAEGGLKPGVGEAMLGIGLATLGVAVAARQPVYAVSARPCYATPFGWRC
jgi:hypothetical protein